MSPTSFDTALLAYLTPEELAELDALIISDPTIWRPLKGPQEMAYDSLADIIGYGGAAGGGKTDLACGKALTRHRRAMILRRVGTELTGIVDRLEELIGSRDGYNGKDNIWRLPNLQIELGAVPNAGDERKFQGRPHDLLVFRRGDELPGATGALSARLAAHHDTRAALPGAADVQPAHDGGRPLGDRFLCSVAGQEAPGPRQAGRLALGGIVARRCEVPFRS